MLIGQDPAGKTSLKKSLLGLPFDPEEQSTEGIEVDPSRCEIDVDLVRNWQSTNENKPGLLDCAKDVAEILAEELVKKAEEDPFEVIEALVAKQINHRNLQQLEHYARKECFIKDLNEFDSMISFYNGLGMIIKHRSTVVLKAQWLIELFKQLISIPHFDKLDPLHAKYWQELEVSGILSMDHVDHVFTSFIGEGIIKDDILGMMEQFDLIAKFSVSPINLKYFVPAQLKSSPDKLLKLKPSSTDPCPMYLLFVHGFVPHGLFLQLVARPIQWCAETWPHMHQPTLYQNGARFIFGKNVRDFALICKIGFIKITLRQKMQSNQVVGQNSVELATVVGEFMKRLAMICYNFTGCQFSPWDEGLDRCCTFNCSRILMKGLTGFVMHLREKVNKCSKIIILWATIFRNIFIALRTPDVIEVSDDEQCDENGTDSASFPGPSMVCVTKEEATYLSFVHCLLRAVPGLSQYLHATGTDGEPILRNATAAGMPNATGLLSYLHSKRNVESKLKELETELAWFGISDKWEVREGFVQHMPRAHHVSMTAEARKAALKKVNMTLNKYFSEQELYALHDKAKAVLIGNTIREGFKPRSFIADSGRPLSYTVQFANSGKCSCTCAYFTRNNICHHCIAAAMRAGKFDDLVASFSTRSWNQMTTSTAPTSVGSKRPPKIRKRTEEEHPFQQTEDEKALQAEPLTSQTVGEITLLIRKKKKPDDPIPSALHVTKGIAGGVQKCAGCRGDISSAVEGFNAENEKHFSFGRFEAYSYWNKNSNSYKSIVSTRHCLLNPVCMKIVGKANIRADLQVPGSRWELVKEKFACNVKE
ncbi:hypothetical protein AWC38_SpisGene18370 [Stylophora pistillata]|uniref:SWIM-type domain-containing protein n=1 Tax=Stylophora pistillata TaxID=50429 RepID=A0A2B4RKH8_STYPI|nr:hypothetical protein AWC38_SpisGene18370 [Stylophora pistillata]